MRRASKPYSARPIPGIDPLAGPPANPAPTYQALQRAALEGLAAGPRKAADLLAGLPAERQAFVFRGLAWMVKMGVAEGAG